MFKFHCPHCQQKISAEEDSSGMNVQCPTCGDDFVVPSPIGEETAEPQSPQESVDTTSSSEFQPAQISHLEPSSEPGTPHSFAERMKDGNKVAKEGAKVLKEGAMVGWAGLKRRSKQAALKAQIEKLRNIDLRKAYHALGKSAFEQGILADKLTEPFQAIHDLDARIAGNREKTSADAGETKMAALKRVSKDTAKSGQSQALTVKREHLITELGREVHARKEQMSTGDLPDGISAIAEIEHRIRDKETEMRALNDGGKSGMQTLAVAAVIGLLVVASAVFGFKLLGNGDKQAPEKASEGQQASRERRSGSTTTKEPATRTKFNGPTAIAGVDKSLFPPKWDEPLSISNYRDGDIIRKSGQSADSLFLKLYLLGFHAPDVVDTFENNYYIPNHKLKHEKRSHESRLLSIVKLGARDAAEGILNRFLILKDRELQNNLRGSTRLQVLEKYFGPKDLWEQRHGFTIKSKLVDKDQEIEYPALLASDFLLRFQEALEN